MSDNPTFRCTEPTGHAFGSGEHCLNCGIPGAELDTPAAYEHRNQVFLGVLSSLIETQKRVTQ